MSHTFDGHIRIEPALNFAEIKKVRHDAYQIVAGRYSGGKAPRWMGETLDPKNSSSFPMKDHLPLTLCIHEAEQETEQGILKVQTADSLVPSNDADGDLRYSMEEQVQRLIKLFPKHTFTGQVTAVETERLDAVKLVVKGGTAEQFGGEAWVHFEDGTKVKASLLL